MPEHRASGTIYYGLDIGGTKIELVACNAALEVCYRRRIATPVLDYAAFLQAVAGLVRAADDALGARSLAVGIGLPGVRDQQGRQISSNVPALRGRRVMHDLQQGMDRPLFVGNDCHCFALSEANGGAADGYPSMFGIILGTGAGGSFCVQGRLLTGANGIAGEWGHWPLPATLRARHELPLLDCPCGLRGCLDRYVSGSGLAWLHRHLGGEEVEASAIMLAGQQGDAVALRALEIQRDLLGQALASLVMVLDPHVIVLGGGLSKFEPLYQSLPAAVAVHLFDGIRVPPILPPKSGDAGGARGAALLARQHCPAG